MADTEEEEAGADGTGGISVTTGEVIAILCCFYLVGRRSIEEKERKEKKEKDREREVSLFLSRRVFLSTSSAPGKKTQTKKKNSRETLIRTFAPEPPPIALPSRKRGSVSDSGEAPTAASLRPKM